MRVAVGTSGFQYKAWRGHFYPERMKEADMLSYYAARLPTVEINQTFYRMPKPELLTRWAAQVPPEFTFAIKASQRITHRLRLRDCEEPLGFLLESVTVLGPRLGSLLFQLPPNFKRDLPRLAAFVALLPAGMRAAFEFRHASWWDDEVYGLLAGRNLALCIADVDEADACTPLVATADYGYLRLRRDSYDEAALDTLAKRLQALPFAHVDAYFKHEDVGPGLAAAFSRRCHP